MPHVDWGLKIVQPVIGGPTTEEAERILTVTEETLKSDEALWAMYEFWRSGASIMS
jgi:hypothetical protein